MSVILDNQRKPFNFKKWFLVAPFFTFFLTSCIVNKSTEDSKLVVQRDTTKESEKSIDENSKKENRDLAEAVKTRTHFYEYNLQPTSNYAYANAYFYANVNPLTRSKSSISLFGIRKLIVKQAVSKVSTFFDRGVATKRVFYEKPNLQALKFDGFNKVLITLKDETLKVYDSDDFDVELYDKGRVNSITEKVFSNNPRSINHKNFKSDLINARKVSFAVRPLMYWSDFSGKRTKYPVRAKDYLAFFLNEAYIGHSQFAIDKFGGSKELNDYWTTVSSTTRFQNISEVYGSEYFFELLGIDLDSLLDYDSKGKRKPVEKLKFNGELLDLLSIYRTDDDSAFEDGLYTFLDTYMWPADGTSAIFLPLPTAFTEEFAAKSKDENLGSGLIRRTGFYWYGIKDEDALYAGAYKLDLHEVIGGKETFIYRKNPNFWDKDWLKQDNNLREIVITKQLTKSKQDYHNRLYSYYSQGQILFLRPFFMDQAIVDRILVGKDSYITEDHIKYSGISGKENDAHIEEIVHSDFRISPPESINEYGEIDTSIYYYNDRYAEFMYGANLETLARGEAKPFAHFFGDDQISFRSLLVSSVNWLRAVDFSHFSVNDNTFSFTSAPLVGKLKGSDEEISPYKTTADAWELSNSSFVVLDGRRAIEVPYQKNKEGREELREIDSFKGGGKEIYFKLQQAMTNLLDKIYMERGWKDEEKIEMTILFYFTNQNKRVIKAGDLMVETLNNLDKKNRLNFTIRLPKEGELYSAYYNKRGYHSLLQGGTLPFEGNTAYLKEALSWRSNFFLPYLTKVLSKLSEKDPNNPFPLLTRLAKSLTNAIEEKKYAIKSLDVFFDLTNKRITEFVFNSKDPLIYDPDKPLPDLSLAKFFFNQKHLFTNEEMVKLNVEISVLKGGIPFQPLFLPANVFGTSLYFQQPGVKLLGSLSSYRDWIFSAEEESDLSDLTR